MESGNARFKCLEAHPDTVGNMGTPAGTDSPASPTTPSRKSRRWLYVTAAVVVIAGSVLGVVLNYEYQPGNALNPYTERVTQFDWYYLLTRTPGDSPVYFGQLPGCTTHNGGECNTSISVTAYNFGYSQVTVTNVSVYSENSTGPAPQLVSSNAPLTIGSDLPQTIVVTVGLPDSNFVGAVSIVLNIPLWSY
jgi:hypothetical protein